LCRAASCALEPPPCASSRRCLQHGAPLFTAVLAHAVDAPRLKWPGTMPRGRPRGTIRGLRAGSRAVTAAGQPGNFETAKRSCTGCRGTRLTRVEERARLVRIPKVLGVAAGDPHEPSAEGDPRRQRAVTRLHTYTPLRTFKSLRCTLMRDNDVFAGRPQPLSRACAFDSRTPRRFATGPHPAAVRRNGAPRGSGPRLQFTAADDRPGDECKNA